ncbi:MAG TPA: DUF3300 domain-containing protein [Tepidisphaeraceae bacterium]|jgi:hypothetical protein|nr:DUF3300 domain-containing protein [Tepidisphaeraceae bacterium]
MDLRNVSPLLASLLTAVAVPSVSFGQVYYTPAPVVVSAPAPTPVTVVRFSDDQLDQLTGPIALYPDPLIATVLPAATYPLDVVSASQWLRANPSPSEPSIDAQPWDPSIRALVHYPTVLEMMASSFDWTQQLGQAYLSQPGDVMNSIQRLRSRAYALGTIASSPQQTVLLDNGLISIVPAQQEIYVPEYDPTVVYVRREPLRFSAGFSIGGWLNFDTDWHNHYIVTGAHWNHPRDHVIIEHPAAYHPWARDPQRPVVHIERPAPRDTRGFDRDPHAAGMIGDYRPRPDVEHEESRGRVSLSHNAPHPAPPVVHEAPHPMAHDAPHEAPHDAGHDSHDDHGGHR